MRSENEAIRRITEDPFFVLELARTASRADAERAGTKILGLLALGLPAGSAYLTPLGHRTRDADLVRAAMAELRDPGRRLRHELWAGARPSSEEVVDETPAPFDALAALGWSDP